MSNSAALGHQGGAWMDDTPEPATRLVNMNHLGARSSSTTIRRSRCCSSTTAIRWRRCRIRTACCEGLQREDLFTVVFEQVLTDTARYADVVLPATTFLEHYDIAKGYGPISLQLVRPVDRAVGRGAPERRRLLGAGRAALASARPEEETDTLLPRRRPAAADGLGADADGARRRARRRSAARRSSSWTSSR